MIRLGKIAFLFTFFALLIQSLLFFDQADELIAVPYALILGGIAAFFLGRRAHDEDADFQVNIFFWAFSIRIWMGLLLYGWGLSELFGDEDAGGYNAAWALASNWYQNGFDGFVSDLGRVIFERQNVGQALIWGIPTFIAGGPSRMIVSITNSFAGALLVIVLFRLARRIFETETARTTAIIATFWASIILLSASTQKEILVIFCSWTVLYLLVRNPSGLSVKDGLASIPAFIVVFIMRFYSLYLLTTAALFRLIVARREHLVRNVIFGSAIVGALAIFAVSSGVINRDFERVERLNRSVEGWRENMAQTTGSGIEVYSEFESTSVAIPVATIYFFFAPFPWEVFSGSGRNAFGAVENVLIIGILIIGFPALKIFFKDKFVELAPIFVFCVLYAGMHIWGLSNVGLAWRHKQTVMPLFFMLAAVAISQRKLGWQRLTGRVKGKGRELTVIRAQ